MVFIAIFSLVIGLTLGLFGGGGGILTVPFLHYALDMPVQEAITTSLIIIAITSVVSSWHYARAEKIIWREGWLFGLTGIIGSAVGALLAGLMPGHSLLLILSLIMLTSGIAMLCRRFDNRSCDISSAQLPLPAIILAGLAIGLVTGLVGAGGGFLVVPALVMMFKLPLPQAIGTSVFVIALNTISGSLIHLGQQQLDYVLITMISLLAVTGTLIGSKLALKISAPLLHIGFAVFIITIALTLMVREVPAILRQPWYLQYEALWLGFAVAISVGLLYFLTRTCLSRIWRLPFFN